MTRAERSRERARTAARCEARKAERAAARAEPPLTRILVCPDVHHPYADQQAWRTFLAVRRVMKPDHTVVIGDFCDFYAVSAHTQDPRRRRPEQLKYEIELTNEAADEFDAAHPGGAVTFCEGNHETRLTRYVASKAPELDGMLNAREALRADKRGWRWVPYKSSIRIGEISFTHDVERCGVNTARQSLQDFGDNIVIGHSHRAAVVYAGTAQGVTHVGMNVGWLGSIDAIDYRHRDMARREWQHSFGWITQTPDGVSWCQVIPIIHGKCVVDGRLITA